MMPTAGEVWWARASKALRAEPCGESASLRVLRAIDELAEELDRRGELAEVLVPMGSGPPLPSRSLDHPEILPLFDELGEVLGVGPVPRERVGGASRARKREAE